MIAVILRGLPGSGKTRVAQALRDVEVENGGEAPKIHSLDDYFMTEVEKEIVVEEEQGSCSSVGALCLLSVLRPGAFHERVSNTPAHLVFFQRRAT